ncbi:MAG: septal ring lytic transglycosylase RlpA family protein [Rhodospirillales bacterium]|nr:septal ring lytic transglycosylase RlpA family protein [Rhodospirillales bacterium]
MVASRISGTARGLALAALALGLSACAESKLVIHAAKQLPDASPAAKPSTTYKVGNAYQINGVWYYPAEDYDYDETGIASWYGPGFHGKNTANGESYDMNDVTAAHRTLPMPSLVRVTNLENGRALVVRINDRGPYANGRIIDLSRRSAQLLGIDRQGTAKVRVQILAEESRKLAAELKGQALPDETKVASAPRESVQAESLPAPQGSKSNPGSGNRQVTPVSASAPSRPTNNNHATVPADLKTQTVQMEAVKPSNLFVQAGAYARFDNANRVRAGVSPIGPAKVTSVMVGQQELFRVRIGPLASVEEADRVLDLVLRSGYPDARTVVD